MRSALQFLCGAALTMFLLFFATMPAQAQTYNESFNFGTYLGTLNYTVTFYSPYCTVEPGLKVQFGRATAKNFVYVPYKGTAQALNIGLTSVYSSPYPDPAGNCPPDVYPQTTYQGSGYSITVQNEAGSVTPTIFVPGYLKPKFVVVGVEYAPPGSSSSVTYTGDTVVGNSTSTSASFSDQVTQTISQSFGGHLFGFSYGQTTTASTSYTQEQDSSSTIAVSETTTNQDSLSGYSDPINGINHDYDYINVWLNPIIQYTITNGGSLIWNGYGYDLSDTRDYPDLDVIGIELGCLNGDFYAAYQSNPTLNPMWLTCKDIFNNNFSRTWALNNTDGSGPALTPTLANSSAPYDFCEQTGTDLYDVCRADPFSDPSYTLSFPSGSDTTTDGRFTACNPNCSSTIDYEPNKSPGYTQGYSSTQSQSQGGKYVYSVSYSVDSQLGTSGWLLTLTSDMKNSNTLTWTHQFSHATNNSQGQTAGFKIVGPPEGYTGPTQFVVYQDNLYGTFMFFPGS